MSIANPSKALIALCALICLTVLMTVKTIDQATGVPILTMIVGYAIGNGIAAKQGEPVEPIIGKKQR